MDKSLYNIPMHLKVYSEGKCKRCGNTEKVLIYDYGKLPYGELEKKMEEVNHHVLPISCSRCGEDITPSNFLYYDDLSKSTIVNLTLQYGRMIDSNEYAKYKEGDKRRFEVFSAQEKEFWDKFLSYCIEHYPKIIQELRKKELIAGLAAIGEPVNKELTESKLRRQAIRVTDPEKQKSFLKEANREIVYEHILDLGPLSWYPEKDIVFIGELRTRFFVLNFPIDESLEPLRTLWIGKVIKKDKGDNAFLFRRINQLTEENERLIEKLTKYIHLIDELNIKIKEREEKLSKAYSEIERLKEEKKVYTRDPKDIRKIQELKGLIHELIEELKAVPEEETQPVSIEEEIEEDIEETIETDKIDLNALAGKTIGIIGGNRERQAREVEYPFEILTHPGNKTDEEFYRIINESDILVILTRFISHIAMWEAKAHAIEEGKPIFFEKNINIPLLVRNVAGNLGTNN